VHNPKLAKVAGPFGAHFQPGGYSLSEREREIAVCVITSHWRSAYPTAAHERLAKEVGLPAAKVEAILGGMPTAFDDEREQVVYEMAIVLSNGAGCRAAFTSAPSRRSATSASPTSSR
jgi:4-carboxymuconolactone decarboxylase